MTEDAPRWSPDDVQFFDATHTPAARKALLPLAARAAELEALGFRELGRTGIVMDAFESGCPIPDAEEIAEARADAAGGDAEAEARLAWLNELANIDTMSSGVHYAWSFVHPETQDVVDLEVNADGEWVSLLRVSTSGAIVRTMRRITPVARPNLAAAGLFHAARVPGLYKLMLALAGESQRVTAASTPKVNYWAQLVGHLPLAEVFAQHRALADRHAEPAQPPDMDLVLAVNRRNIASLFSRIEMTDYVGFGWMFVWSTVLSRVLPALAVGGFTGSIAQAAVAGLALHQLAWALWSWCLGLERWWVPLPWFALLVAWSIGMQTAPAIVLGSAALSFLLVVVAALGFHTLTNGLAPRIMAHVSEPPSVTPADLVVLYRA